MKRYIYNVYTMLSLFLAGFAISACSDQDYAEYDKGRDLLTLTAEQSETTLVETNHASDAVTFNWTSGNNYGTGNRISYRLELAKAGTDFTAPFVAVDNQTQVYAWSVNVENLNNIIIDKLGGTAGTPIDLEARVTAFVSGVEETQVATASFSATPYEAVTSSLYIIGSAAPNGWSADNAEEMKRESSDKERMMMKEFKPYEMIYLVGDATPNGWDLANATSMTATDSPYVFTWTGELNAGELKLSCDKQSDWNGAWFMASAADAEPTGTTEHTLFVNKSDDAFKAQYVDVNVGDIDYKWKITASGSYTITIDQLNETISISKN